MGDPYASIDFLLALQLLTHDLGIYSLVNRLDTHFTKNDDERKEVSLTYLRANVEGLTFYITDLPQFFNIFGLHFFFSQGCTYAHISQSTDDLSTVFLLLPTRQQRVY